MEGDSMRIMTLLDVMRYSSVSLTASWHHRLISPEVADFGSRDVLGLRNMPQYVIYTLGHLEELRIYHSPCHFADKKVAVTAPTRSILPQPGLT